MTSHATCTECNRPLNDGEYFILNGDGTGVHHECPETCPICEESVPGTHAVQAAGGVYHKGCMDSKLPSIWTILNANHAPTCPVCSKILAHDDQTVLVGDELHHFDCVREINADLDALACDVADFDGEEETLDYSEEEGCFAPGDDDFGTTYEG